jgi:hypothetical protein
MARPPGKFSMVPFLRAAHQDRPRTKFMAYDLHGALQERHIVVLQGQETIW